MDAIRIQRACFIAGKPVERGAVFAVPREIEPREARALVRIRVAEVCDAPAAAVSGGQSMPPRARRKSAEAHA